MSGQQPLLTLEQPANSGFVERSLRLQRILRDAGYGKGTGISTAGLRLVSRVAKREKLRDWPDTRSWADYDALIDAVATELGIPNAIGMGREENAPPQQER